MKNWIWVVAVIVILVVVGGYVERHKIKAMLGMSQPTTAIVAQNKVASNKTITTVVPSINANNIYLIRTDSTKGQFLTDPKGITLYTFAKDKPGISNCIGPCLTIWPPYMPSKTAPTGLPNNISVITRTDGVKQYAWKGMPLYYFKNDTKPGDIKGDGYGGVWHIVKP